MWVNSAVYLNEKRRKQPRRINRELTINQPVVQARENGIGWGLSYQYLSATTFVTSGGIFYIFVAKLLPTSALGAISLLLAIASLMNIAFSFGFPISAQHFISFNLGMGDHSETRSVARKILMISTVLSSGSLIFSLVTARWFAILFFHTPYDTLLIEAASFYIAIGVFFGVLHGSALGFQMFRTDAIIYLSSASFSYILGLLLLLIFHGIIYLIIGMTICYLYGSILYLIYIFFKRPKVTEQSDKTSLPVILSYSWPILLSGLIGYGSTYIDRFVVAYFLNLSTLGIYSFVLLVSSSLSFLGGPIANVLVPKLSEYFSIDDNEKLKKGINLSSTVMMLVYSPLAFGLASIAPVALLLLARPVYATGNVALMILLVTSSIFVLGGIMGSVIYAVRKTGVYVITTALTLVSNLILSFLLIPRYGMIGAAIANSSVSVVTFIILYHYAVGARLKNFDWNTTLKVWFSSLIMFVLVTAERMALGNFLHLLPLYVVTGVLYYWIAINVTRSLHRVQREEFLSYIPSRFSLRKIVSIFLIRAF